MAYIYSLALQCIRASVEIYANKVTKDDREAPSKIDMFKKALFNFQRGNFKTSKHQIHAYIYV